MIENLPAIHHKVDSPVHGTINPYVFAYIMFLVMFFCLYILHQPITAPSPLSRNSVTKTTLV